MIAIDFFQKKNLTISFAGSEVTIEIDDTIYLNSQKTKDLLSQMDFSDPDKQLANTLKAKELVWQLHEMLRQHLNRLGSRDRDYDLLEKEYRLIETANCFLFYGIQFLQGKLNDFAAMLDNVFAQMNGLSFIPHVSRRVLWVFLYTRPPKESLIFNSFGCESYSLLPNNFE